MSSALLLVVALLALTAVVVAPGRRGRTPRRDLDGRDRRDGERTGLTPAVAALGALAALGLLPPLSAGGPGAVAAGVAAAVTATALAVLQMRLLRRRLVTSAVRSWLDLANGVPAGLGLVWAFAVGPLSRATGASEALATAQLAPLGLLWLCLTFCATSTLLVRPADRRMVLVTAASALALGAEVTGVAAAGGSGWGEPVVGVLRAGAALLVAAAALRTDEHEARQAEESAVEIVIAPVALTCESIALLAWHLVSPLPVAAAWAALAAVVLTTVKTVVVFQQLDALNSLRAQAMTDALTGLGNRRALESALGVVDDVAARARSTALVVIDLDRFKAVNDTHGHGAGDELLVELAHRLREAPADGEVAVRLGGDEFALVLPGASLETARTRAQAAVEALGRPVRLGAVEARVGASAGVAVVPLHAASADALREAADAAMYEAKRRGGVVVAQPVGPPAAAPRAERRAGERRRVS